MGSAVRPHPVGLLVADEPAAWRAAGFAVDDQDYVRLGEIKIKLTGRSQCSSGGITGWSWAHLDRSVHQIQGIPTTISSVPAAAVGTHPNGALTVDHIVLISPDWQLAVKELKELGLQPLRQTNRVRSGVTQVPLSLLVPKSCSWHRR